MKLQKIILINLLIVFSISINYSQNDFQFDTSPTRFKGHRTSVSAVRYSPDGKILATCGGKNQIILFNAQNGEQIASSEEGAQQPVNFLDYSYDGTMIASVGYSSKKVQIWDPLTMKVIRSIDGFSGFSAIKFSPINNTIGILGAYGDDDMEFAVALFNSEGKRIREFFKASSENAYPTCLDFSADGKYLAVGFSNKDNSIKIWDIETGNLTKLIKHTHDITDLNFSPDGLHIAGGGIDKNVNIWEISSGKMIHKLEGFNDYVGVVIYSPDGKHIVGAGSDNDSKYKMWNASSGKLIQSEDQGGPDINSLEFSPDGQSMAMGLRTYGDLFDVATVYVYRTPEGTSSIPWFKISSSESKLQLEYPSEPIHSIRTSGSYAYHNIKLDNGSTIMSYYGVQYLYSINNSTRSSAVQSKINHYAKDLSNIEKTTFYYNGTKGYEMVGYKKDIRYRYRFIFIGDMNYQLSVSSFDKKESSLEKRYMESFAIPGQTTNAIQNTTAPISKTTFKVGDRIQGNWKGGGKYYPGKIARLNGNKVYIQYDDGDVESTTTDYIKKE